MEKLTCIKTKIEEGESITNDETKKEQYGGYIKNIKIEKPIYIKTENEKNNSFENEVKYYDDDVKESAYFVSFFQDNKSLEKKHILSEVKRNRKKSADNDTNVDIPVKKSCLESRLVSECENNWKNKNALMILNELGLPYFFSIFSKEGPDHNPTFAIKLQIENNTFFGNGSSKKLAKQSAAQKAIIFYLKKTNPILAENFQKFYLSDITTPSFISNVPGMCQIPTQINHKCAVSLLNEMHLNTKYDLLEESGQPHKKCFKMGVTINNKQYLGIGNSKKSAKAAAAHNAIKDLLSGTHYFNIQKQSGISTTLGDKIAKVVMEQFQLLIADSSKYQEYEVLAAIVLTEDKIYDKGRVICLATGNKNISKKNTCYNGLVLNDCHAEIIVRRCLLDFLYTQLETQAYTKNPLLEMTDSGLFQLRENYALHLYITEMPCGDSRYKNFTLKDMSFMPNFYSITTQQNQLTVKINGSDETVPVSLQKYIQIWFGTDKSYDLAMSCSDKLMKWNIVGLQGALLCYLMKPIYLKSIIVGSSSVEHLNRIVVGRLNFLKDIPEPFHINQPHIFSTLNQVHQSIHSSLKGSINWTVGMSRPELINSSTGTTIQNQPSRLSKVVFFRRWHKLINGSSEYRSAKRYSELYQNCFRKLEESLHAEGFGKWIHKHAEQDNFRI